jgi:hypothetical protein
MLKTFMTALAVSVCTTGMALANPFAAKTCQTALPADWKCIEVQAGTSWDWLVPDAQYRKTIQKFNRQNGRLQAGQLLVVPPSYLDWNQLAPFKQTDYISHIDVVVFDPQKLAWVHYIGGRLNTWGPAVGGKQWCSDKNNGRGGPCKTKVGTFSFTEAAGPKRRSNAYPVGCVGSRCAPMPHFTRFTSGGQGIHARSMRGANASHGCIGVFADDAVYINGHVRARIGKSNYGYFTDAEKTASAASTPFIVLPYSSLDVNS